MNSFYLRDCGGTEGKGSTEDLKLVLISRRDTP